MVRGRSVNLHLPETRELVKQREFRARRAARLKDLEEANARLIEENEALRAEVAALKRVGHNAEQQEAAEGLEAMARKSRRMRRDDHRGSHQEGKSAFPTGRCESCAQDHPDSLGSLQQNSVRDHSTSTQVGRPSQSYEYGAGSALRPAILSAQSDRPIAPLPIPLTSPHAQSGSSTTRRRSDFGDACPPGAVKEDLENQDHLNDAERAALSVLDETQCCFGLVDCGPGAPSERTAMGQLARERQSKVKREDFTSR